MFQKRVVLLSFALSVILLSFSKVNGQTPNPTNLNNYFPIIINQPSSGIFLNSYSEYDEGPNHVVVGEMINWSSSPVYDPGVSVEIKGSAPVSTYRTIRTFIRCLLPNRTSPFKVVFAGLPPGSKVSHISWSYGYPSSEYPPCLPAQIASQQFHDDYGSTFYVQVSNNTQKPMYSVVVVVSMYDAIGNIIDVEKNAYPVWIPPLSSGEHGPFYQVNTAIRANQFADYIVQAEGFTSEGTTFP